MKEKHPEFVERLEEEGLVYNRVMGEEDDPSSAIGRGWKSTFGTADKMVAGQRYFSSVFPMLQVHVIYLELTLMYKYYGPDMNTTTNLRADPDHNKVLNCIRIKY
ncbi:unnamed protein product [Linum tenue]|uniref:Uncharacterized protein n=1 Tax=Linum tenue TaxID=586396 RepID=A0AAV0KMY6_9ROSI|nr:unnamed protein product [Linum tenue]